MRYSITLANPDYEIVSLSESKDDLEILQTETRHDNKITSYIQGATNDAENFTCQLFAQRAITINLDYLKQYISLPVHPIESIDSVTYFDSNNALQVLSSSDYESDLNAFSPLLRVTSIPKTKNRLNAVQINVIAGYKSNDITPTADLVPSAIKKAVRFKVYQDFINRGGSEESVRMSFENLLYPYRHTKL